jgi:lysophospholipase L1-like esterase
VDHNVNSLGLRGPERPAGLLPGAFRVACVGDSFTYGHGVSDDETWPAALERALARQPRAQPVVTLNHGVYSFDAEQNARMIETRVADFRPHLVILCWYFNDPAIHGSTAADGLPPPDLLRLLSVQQGGWVAWLRERSYLADWIGHELFVALQRDYYVDSRGGFYDDDSVTWRRSRAALRRARDAARRVGAELAVVLYPALFRDGDELLGREQYAKVAATCDELDVAVFDLAPVFAGRDLDALRVHSHNDHPNGEAHRLAGEALADWLTGRGLVPPSGSGAAADPPPRVSAR